MKKIGSFEIDHRTLEPQVRLAARKDYQGTPVTVFDIRLRKPNTEAIDTDGLHSLEHLLVTVLRSREEIDQVLIDLSPMGCRTGFYMSMFGHLEVSDVIPILRQGLQEVLAWTGEVPGATEIECGNYRDHNLAKAQEEARRFLEVLAK